METLKDSIIFAVGLLCGIVIVLLVAWEKIVY